MVLKLGKCHFMCLRRNTEKETFAFKNKIKENSEEQLKSLNFKSHVEFMWKSLAKGSGSSKTMNVLKWSTKELNIQVGNKISI